MFNVVDSFCLGALSMISSNRFVPVEALEFEFAMTGIQINSPPLSLVWVTTISASAYCPSNV